MCRESSGKAGGNLGLHRQHGKQHRAALALTDKFKNYGQLTASESGLALLVHDREEAMSEEIEEKQFESSMQIKDWKKRVWRFNYTKHIKSIDWEVVTPKGEIKVTKMGDFELAKRCLDNLGIINQLLLEHEVK